MLTNLANFKRSADNGRERWKFINGEYPAPIGTAADYTSDDQNVTSPYLPLNILSLSQLLRKIPMAILR